MAQQLIELVRNKFPNAILGSYSQHGDETIIVDPKDWLAVGQFLRDDPGCDMALLADLTGVDYPQKLPRFEVVAHLVSLRLGHRLRVKARVGKADGSGAQIDSWSGLWASANWAERECYDLMGIEFRGHPDLRRILMYPEFLGHPLRKDYPAQRIQPLVPYRNVENIQKLPPFGPSEGMPFGRQTHNEWQTTRELPDDDLD
jgi:NADH-quinone oxidoreductase subunit C